MKKDINQVIKELNDFELNKQLLIALGWEMRPTSLNSQGEQLFQLYTPDGKAYPPNTETPWPETTKPESVWKNICDRLPYVKYLPLAWQLFDGEHLFGNLFRASSKMSLFGRPVVGKHQASCYSVIHEGVSGFALHDENPARAICEATLQTLWKEKLPKEQWSVNEQDALQAPAFVDAGQ